MLTPPEQISTTEAARRYRWIRNAEGTGKRLWSLELTPFLKGPQDALDDPAVREVIIVGPGRSGKTKAFENHLFRRMRFGPLTDTLWYIGSGSEVASYVEREVKPLFEDHPEIRRKLGPSKSDNKLAFKRVSGRTIEYLPVNDHTVTGREGGLIIGDEIDTIKPARRRNAFRQNMRQRGRAIGSRRKIGMCSHPDAGWTSGIAAAWKESSRGMFVWPCAECGLWSSPHQLAEHRTQLTWRRVEGMADDEALDLAAATAAMSCPHCGVDLNDAQRLAMVDAGDWMHGGQVLDPERGIIGEARPNEAMGFWIHALMMKNVKLEQLAREVEAALRKFESTRKPDLLRELTAKTLGEVYEGAGTGNQALDPTALRRRAREAAKTAGFEAGTVPDGVRFVTAAVDVGHRKFDVMIVGWDLEGRSWIIERFTITTRRLGSRDVDIRPAERQEDWLLLREQVLDRELPLVGDPTIRMPVAGMAVDVKDGHVTWKAREFARRMARAGQFWGSAAAPWFKVRPIMGSKSPGAPELPLKGREISVDERGQKVAPVLLEWDLGVFKLKELTLERLAETEGGPGQVSFAEGLPRSTFDEFAGEVLIDGKWERRGPNESLDLHGYNEAVRLMLRPDRADIKWETRPPIWARPVPIEDDDETLPGLPIVAGGAPKPSPIDRLAALNRR